MKDLMLDIETLGREPGCVILSIGAVVFDPKVKKPITTDDSFYTTVDATSQLLKGFHIHPETLEWWKTQDKTAQEMLSVSTVPIETALGRFKAWCVKKGIEKVWCQGANFDAPIMQKAFEICGIETPWKFYSVRDTRTVYDTYDFDYKSLKRGGTYHNALDDALHQVRLIQTAILGAQ